MARIAHINLLPWREWEKQRHRKNFLSLLGFSALGVVAALVLIHTFFSWRIEAQNARNAFLEQQITILGRKMFQLESAKKEKDALIEKIKTIVRLQATRPLDVHIVDQLVRTVPSTIQLTSVSNAGGFLTLNGIADSSAAVSDYLAALSQSWVLNLRPPDLKVLSYKKDGSQRWRSYFTIVAKIRDGS